jgi:[ribosomal protein S5]-alanine N-acetyltransferase
MKTYSSERIYLREILISDINETVMAWFQDEELMKYYSSSKTRITKEILLTSIEEGKKLGNLFTYGIFEQDTDVLIGTVKLGPISFIHKTSDLVTLIGNRNYLGKGLAVEAIKLGIELAFAEFDLRKLYGGMYLSNIPSIKAYTRAGWLIEGRLKGFYLVDGKNEDRLLVGCFNPKYFTAEEIENIKSNENRYFQF